MYPLQVCSKAEQWVRKYLHGNGHGTIFCRDIDWISERLVHIVICHLISLRLSVYILNSFMKRARKKSLIIYGGMSWLSTTHSESNHKSCLQHCRCQAVADADAYEEPVEGPLIGVAQKKLKNHLKLSDSLKLLTNSTNETNNISLFKNYVWTPLRPQVRVGNLSPPPPPRPNRRWIAFLRPSRAKLIQWSHGRRLQRHPRPGMCKSVTITDCHSNSVTLIVVLNESGISKTVTVADCHWTRCHSNRRSL